MRIDIDTTHVVKVVLSERNVRDLLEAIESGRTELTLSKSFGVDTKGVIVGVEYDEVHYADSQKAIVDLAAAEVYCPKHDLYSCWFCEAV